MNTFATYDPASTLVEGVVFSMTPPANSIPVFQNDLDNFKSTGGISGWTVESGVLSWPTPTTLLLSAQNSQKKQMRLACANRIYAGFTFTYNATPYTVTLREDAVNHNQSNLLGLMISANFVLQGSKLWQPGAVFAPNSFCNDSKGIFYVTYTGGTTASQEPTWPTEFLVSAPDNNITWYKMGFRVSTVQGRIIVDPANLVLLGQTFISFKNQMQGYYDQIKTQIDAATTIAEVNAITWPY